MFNKDKIIIASAIAQKKIKAYFANVLNLLEITIELPMSIDE